jgi:hypothetical protein
METEKSHSKKGQEKIQQAQQAGGENTKEIWSVGYLSANPRIAFDTIGRFSAQEILSYR